MGVFQASSRLSLSKKGLPHARGGVSKGIGLLRKKRRSSPRTWGCFRDGRYGQYHHEVFPTHVGVFPYFCDLHNFCVGLPHARGGVSRFGCIRRFPSESSPRTWGCFSLLHSVHPCSKVFPTHVGVFQIFCCARFLPRSLPHARGGVSHVRQLHRHILASSPRTWGCFCPDLASIIPGRVFPTHVGVFPSTAALLTSIRSLPHARGGVSTNRTRHRRTYPSSPRTWGCFR